MFNKTEPKKAEPEKVQDKAPKATQPAPATKTGSDVAAFDPDEGERARNETMKPGPLKTKGQTGTVSGAKRG